MSDTSRFVYLVRDGVLKLEGQIRYQDRELRSAMMRLFMVRQHQVCLDLSSIPSLCSPEIQFITKMAELARDSGKFFRVRLSKTLRTMFKDLELEGLVEIEEVGDAPPAARRPASAVKRPATVRKSTAPGTKDGKPL